MTAGDRTTPRDCRRHRRGDACAGCFAGLRFGGRSVGGKHYLVVGEALLLRSVGGSSGHQLGFGGELRLDVGGVSPGREQFESGSAARLAVYTDGACLMNPGPGGWAWVVPEDQDAPEAGRQESGSAAKTTNQRMELTAVLQALDSLRDVAALDVYSDSRYVVDCFEKRWWEGWMRRGWRTSSKKPVKNLELWRPLLELALKRDVEFHWVKAHDGNRWNELADCLAYEAARRLADG